MTGFNPSPNDPTIGEAMAALAAAESGDSPESIAPVEPKPDSASPPPPAPVEPEKEEATPPEPTPGETPGAPATPVEPEKKEETKAAKFAQNEERKRLVWSQIKAEKEAFRAEQAEFKAAKEAFERERLTFQRSQLQAQKSTVKSPEFYEQGAATMERNAEAAEKRGEFDAADELRVKAKLAKNLAAELRANPPKPDPTAEETEKQWTEQVKTWTGKAGVDFPELLKKTKDDKGNEVESPAMQRLKGMLEPKSPTFDKVIWSAVENSPEGIYYASRLAVAETGAARVPTLEKELADSRAEVKKLNGKLSVNGGGLVNGTPQAKDFAQMSEAEQEEYLRQEAAQMGNRR